MRRLSCTAALLCSLAWGAAHGASRTPDDGLLEGQWKLDARKSGDHVQLTLRRDWHSGSNHSVWSSSNDVLRRDLEGLPPWNRRRPDGPISLSLVREAGTIHLEGRFEDGRGSGDFRFAPDPAFVADLRRAGFDEVGNEELIRLCIHDVGRRWIRNFKGLGLRDPSLDDLLRLRSHDVTVEFVQALSSAGYSGLDADEVIRLKAHGVTPEYVGGLGRGSERHPTVDEVVRLKAHGVEASYVRELSPRFDPDEIVRLHTHGVSTLYVQEFRALGYQTVTADELVRLKIRGVSPAFARRARERHGRLTPDELVRLRNRGEI